MTLILTCISHYPLLHTYMYFLLPLSYGTFLSLLSSVPFESWVDLSSVGPHSGAAGPGSPSRPLRMTLSHSPHCPPSCPLQLQHSLRLSPLPALGNLAGYHHSVGTPLKPVPKFVSAFWVLSSMPNHNPSFIIAGYIFLNSYSSGTCKSEWESFFAHPLCPLSFPSHTHLLTFPVLIKEPLFFETQTLTYYPPSASRLQSIYDLLLF